MSSYIEKAFCRGVVPAGVPAFSHERRDQLVKMLGTSEKVRVITAPSGYGKSALSASFANTKQCFKDTVWVDCLSSCFIRDLSNNAMREMFAHVIDNIKLCVFDEVPHLPEREEGLFVELVNLLADNNIDVTINTPSEAKNFFLEKAYNFHLKPFDLLCEKK